MTAIPTIPAPISAPGAGPASAGPPPQDPFLHDLLTRSTPDQQAQFQQALATQLRQTATAGVQGWSTPHVEKASFPFQVDRQSRIWSPRAAAQLAGNKSTVISMLTNPAIANVMLLAAEQAVKPDVVPVNHDVSDPDFLKFYQALTRAGSQNGNYTFYGTLVNVGWGSGDHVNVTSESLPDGPNAVAGHLASATTRYLFQA